MKAWLDKTRQAATTFWAMREARERKLLVIAALVIVGAAYYLLLIAPAVAARQRLAKYLPLLREQVTRMQALSGEAASLSAKARTDVAAMSKETLSTTLTAHGLKVQSLSVSDEFAQLRLVNVSYAQTLNCLDELQRTAHISVSDAQIIVLAQPDQIDATLTLRQARKL